MANRINEYPARLMCPLVNHIIEDFDCVETQTCAEGMLKPDSMPAEYKENPSWRQICLNCQYHEID